MYTKSIQKIQSLIFTGDKKALKAGFEDYQPHISSLFYVDGLQISMEHRLLSANFLVAWLDNPS